jgi:hypothetical protein
MIQLILSVDYASRECSSRQCCLTRGCTAEARLDAVAAACAEYRSD